MNEFQALLSPGKIGSLAIENRMIVPGMVTQYCTEDGLPTERYIRYHEEKVRGGWGLVITEDYAICENVKSFKRIPGLWSDEQIAPHAEFVRRVHKAGGVLGAQIFHPGRQANPAFNDGVVVGPSPIKEPAMTCTPRELSVEEIHEIVEAFASAARRVKECGFDLVEIHGAHGYLLNQFMSSFANKRTDRYGGTIENRARMALEVVRAVRREVGDDFPISYRLQVNDHVAGGITVGEARVFARLLEAAGVDLLNCSQGMVVSKEFTIPPTAIAPGSLVEDAAQIRSAVKIPVAAVGRIVDPYMAEDVLASGKADFVALGRASLADPLFPQKVKDGCPNEILQCIGCCRGCTGQNSRSEPIGCLVNPFLGHEGVFGDMEWPRSTKRVLVAGGGVSGCYAALLAARRGCEVRVVEKADRLGGQWNLASVPPGKEGLSTFVAWLGAELERYGVDVRLNEEATVKLVSAFAPDTVVVATGSDSFYPLIPGLRENDAVVDARDVLAGQSSCDGCVAVMGGGLVGAEVAALLSSRGQRVTLYEMTGGIASDAESTPRKLLLRELSMRGVEMLTGTRVMEVEGRCVVSEASGEGAVRREFDAIVAAFGSRPSRNLAYELREAGIEHYVVGDASSIKDGFLNVIEGYEAGLHL